MGGTSVAAAGGATTGAAALGSLTKAELNTAISDGDALYVGDVTATTIGALIGGSADATPNDSDFVATSLTAAGVLKKITWTNAKAFLKTYFDTLYGRLATANNWTALQTFTTADPSNPNVDLAIFRQNFAGTVGHEGLLAFTNISGTLLSKIGTLATGNGTDVSLVFKTLVASGLVSVLTLASSVATFYAKIRVPSIELGHDTDTTITRVSVGVIAVEGEAVARIKDINGLIVQATAAATETLTSNSVPTYQWTGTTAAQVVQMPVVSALQLGWTHEAINDSTQSVTYKSSGGNLIATVTAGQRVKFRCVLLTGTAAASWKVDSATWATYTPTVTSTTGTNPTLPTSAVITGSYSVSGKVMLLNLKYYAAATTGGAAGTESYQYSLPAGYVIDLTKTDKPTVLTNTNLSGIDGGVIGAGFGRNDLGTSNASGLIVMALSSTTIGAYLEAQTKLIGAGALSVTGDTNTAISMVCQIPLA